MTPLVPRTRLEAQTQAKGTTAFEHVLQAGGVLSALGEFTTPSPCKISLPQLLPLPEVQAEARGSVHQGGVIYAILRPVLGAVTWLPLDFLVLSLPPSSLRGPGRFWHPLSLLH